MAETGNQQEESDPAQAFDDLRAEVSVLRRAVEALPRAWEENQPPDYTTSLGTMMKGLTVVATQLEHIEKQPALRQTPNSLTEAIGRAGDQSVQAAMRAFTNATGKIGEERQQLAELIGTVHTRREQRSWLLWTGGLALIIGIVLSPVVAMILPFGLDGRVAALIMKNNRWDAGIALMKAEHGDIWNTVANDTNLLQANRVVVSACSEAAAKTKKAQRCTINVPAP